MAGVTQSADLGQVHGGQWYLSSAGQAEADLLCRSQLTWVNGGHKCGPVLQGGFSRAADRKSRRERPPIAD